MKKNENIQIQSMKIYAVIVTYGDRFHLLEQVMNACYKEGVNKIRRGIH